MYFTFDFSVFERLLTEDGAEKKPEIQKTSCQFMDVAGAGYQRQSKVRAGMLNVRSIVHKSPQVTELIKENDLDIFLVTETWLKGQKIEEDFKKKFQIYQVDRKDGQGGGVAVLVSNNLNSKHVSERFPDVTTFEYMAVKIKRENWEKPALVINVYRPPRGNFKNFWEDLKNLLDKAFEKYEDVIVAGDLNSKWKTFQNALNAKGCKQHVNQPTHDAGGILDMVISKINHLKISDLTVRDDGISDHCTVYFNINVGKKTENVPKGHCKLEEAQGKENGHNNKS